MTVEALALELAAIGASAPDGAWDDIPPSDATIFSLWADVRRLREFAQAVLAEWPHDAGLDGFELQDLAVAHGLLAPASPAPTSPCGESCTCVEYHDPENWASGVICFRRTALLTGK